jgi:hypothetical protein
MELVQQTIRLLKVADLKPSNAREVRTAYAFFPDRGLVHGDHLIVPPVGADAEAHTYYHHGLYLGNDRVAHFTGPNKAESVLRITTFGEFIGNRVKFHVVPYESADMEAEAQARVNTVLLATKLVEDKALAAHYGFEKYHAYAANCETFAWFCKTGGADAGRSDQALRLREAIEKDIKSSESKILGVFSSFGS